MFTVFTHLVDCKKTHLISHRKGPCHTFFNKTSQVPTCQEVVIKLLVPWCAWPTYTSAPGNERCQCLTWTACDMGTCGWTNHALLGTGRYLPAGGAWEGLTGELHRGKYFFQAYLGKSIFIFQKCNRYSC